VKKRSAIYAVIGGLFASLFIAIGPLSPAHAVLTCAQGGTCAISDTGPGGGKVFYVDANGFPCGPTFSNTGSPTGGLCRYLEVAPSTWYIGASETTTAILTIRDDRVQVPNVYTNNSGSLDNSLARIGQGYQNTIGLLAFTSGAPSTQARAVRTYAGGSNSDWYIPDSAEALLMCQWSHGVTTPTPGNACTGTRNNLGVDFANYYFANSYYWTSSQVYNSAAADTAVGGKYGGLLQQFQSAYGNTADQWGDTNIYLRPIRAFGLVSAPAFTISKSTETAYVGTAISGYSINSTGGAVASYSISPDISTTPSNGISFNTSTGLISGTPTAAAPAVTYTITGTNASGSATATYALTVNAASTSNSAQAAADAAAQVQKDKDTANVLGTLVLAIGSIQQGLATITRAAITPGSKKSPASSAKKAPAVKVNPKPKPTTKP
jgi:hypothetical protein